jgi:hypothetical protein
MNIYPVDGVVLDPGDADGYRAAADLFGQFLTSKSGKLF